jgi:hypothetical protein
VVFCTKAQRLGREEVGPPAYAPDQTAKESQPRTLDSSNYSGAVQARATLHHHRKPLLLKIAIIHKDELLASRPSDEALNFIRVGNYRQSGKRDDEGNARTGTGRN